MQKEITRTLDGRGRIALPQEIFDELQKLGAKEVSIKGRWDGEKIELILTPIVGQITSLELVVRDKPYTLERISKLFSKMGVRTQSLHIETIERNVLLRLSAILDTKGLITKQEILKELMDENIVVNVLRVE
jgi:hypothetical protein